GMTTAYWLHQHGHEPVVIERAPDLRRDGYGLDFFGAGYDVAERMGIIDALAKRQIFRDKEDSIAFVDDDGRVKVELKVEAVRRQVLDGKYMGQIHYNLEEVLYDAIKDNVKIRFGTSIKAVDQSPAAVTVTYDNGDSETFDLLVGADGIHSNVRGLVFGPEKDYAYFMGYYYACYHIPDRHQLKKMWENYTEPGRQIGAYHTDREGQLAALLIWEAEDEGYIPPEQRADKLRTAYAGMGWITSQLLADIPAN
ncbi:MAG: FAD-dependent monooxygenase, partial [Anaerolineae bacterium]|nr:FAD-dependent monooxygenase [Anaerolineae bacterium]